MINRKDFLKNLIFVAFIASLIFIIQAIMFNQPYVGYGDYYKQQIAFYKHAHEFIRNGNWLWDWTSELGGEFLPTYSFYLTFSPFFLITLLFPNEWIIFEMPILIVLKIMLSNSMALLYFKDKFKKKELVFLASFLYAFSGWTFDSIFFNHFIEVMAFFPLYLFLFEKTVSGKIKYWFMIMTAFMLLLNYYFWVGTAIFIAIYFVVRKIFDKEYVSTKEGIIRFVIEGFIGVGITCIFMLPIATTILQNPRATSKIVENLFLYEDIQLYFAIIQSALHFPSSLISAGGWLHVFEYGCPSQVLYIPVLGVFLLPAFFMKSSKKWLKAFIAICFVISFVPVLNSMFSLFSLEHYYRWFYMFTFFIIWAIISLIDEFEFEEIKKEIIISVIIIVAIYIITCVVGYNLYVKGNINASPLNIYFSTATFIYTLIMFLVSIINKNKRAFFYKTIALSAVSVLFCYSYTCYNQLDMDADYFKKYEEMYNIENAKIEDDGFYRIYNYDYLNSGLIHNKSSVIGYNSVVNNSIYDFYALTGNERTVYSSFILENSPLLELFSTKYIYKNNQWVEREYFLPIGIVFNEFKSVFNYDTEVATDRELAEKLYLYYDDYERFSHLQTEYKDIPNISEYTVNDVKIKKSKYSNKEVFEFENKGTIKIEVNCRNTEKILINGTNIKASSKNGFCIGDELTATQAGYNKVEIFYTNIGNSVKSANLKNMTFTDSGFSADSNLEKEELVFFSIPYSDLWDAYIDGKEVEKIKGYNAFIVLNVPSGEHHIDIIYNTKYYRYGAIISCIFGLMTVAYILIDINRKKAY